MILFAFLYSIQLIILSDLLLHLRREIAAWSWGVGVVGCVCVVGRTSGRRKTNGPQCLVESDSILFLSEEESRNNFPINKIYWIHSDRRTGNLICPWRTNEFGQGARRNMVYFVRYQRVIQSLRGGNTNQAFGKQKNWMKETAETNSKSLLS